MFKLYSGGKRAFLFCLTVVLVFAFGFGSVPVHASDFYNDSYTDDSTHLTWKYYHYFTEKTAVITSVVGIATGENQENPVTDLIIPEKIGDCIVTGFDSSAFDSGFSKDSEKLVSVTIPETVKELPNQLFGGCTSLKTVNILCKNLESIGANAFKNCTSLTSLDYPETVRYIGSRAFYNCDSLESFTVSDGVEELGNGAFISCDNLKSVVIGANVESLNQAFDTCRSLQSVVIRGCNTEINGNSFAECSRLISITLPCVYDKTQINDDWNIVVEDDMFYIKNTSVKGTFSYFHDYSNDTYDWVDDNGVIKCIAEGECNCDDPHTGKETVTAVGYVTTRPNCSQKGRTTYVAKFEDPGFCTQIFEQSDIEPNSDHSWKNPTYEWTTETDEDGDTIYKCTAERICSRDNTHKETETVIAATTVLHEVSYIQDGKVYCAANFENSAFKSQTTMFTVPKLIRPTVAPIPLPEPGEDITYYIDVLPGQHPVIDQDSDVIISSGGAAISVITDSSMVEWLLDEYDASIKLNGNVSIGSETAFGNTGVYIEVDDGKASADISGDVYSNGNITSRGVHLNGGYYGDIASANVGGSITSHADFESYGLLLENGKQSVSVGKDISVSAETNSAGIHADYVYGNVSVGGSVKSEGKLAEGLNLNIDSDWISPEDPDGGFTVDIGKDIIATSTATEGEFNPTDMGAYGIKFYNNGSKVSVDIKGDVITNSPYNMAYAVKTEHVHFDYGYIFTGGPNDIQIHGNLKSNGTGIFIDTVGEDISNNILVENTIDARYPVVLQRSEYLSQMDNYDELQNTPSYMLDPTINLTAWKIIPDESGSIATVRDTDDPADFGLAPEGDLAENFEKSINYIIKYDQPEKGGTFALTDIDGNDLEKSYDLETAHEGDKVYIIPTIEEGYELKGVYNGVGDKRKELTTDEDGKYYIVVPKGGGIYISMDVEIPAAPTPTLAPTSVPTVEPTSDPSGEPSSTPSVSPSSAPTSGNDATPAPGGEATPTPGGVTPTSTPGGEVTPGNATPTPGVTPTPAEKKDYKTTFSIKNKSKVKSSAKIKIKDKDKIKKVTLNGKTIKIKKNKKKITIKLKSNKKKLLKNKKKWNKLVVTDKNGNKTTLKFKIK